MSNENGRPNSEVEVDDSAAGAVTPSNGAKGGENGTKPASSAEQQSHEATEEKDKNSPIPRPMKLNSVWTLWFDNPKMVPASTNWKDSLKQLATFQTIPDFWRVYNNVLPPSMISIGSNYSIFREGIEPTWEDPQNFEGGKFVLTVPKQKQQQKQQVQEGKDVPKLDEYWLFTVLAVLGETMDAAGDQVCGAVVSVRKSQDRIALWLKSGDQEICVRIGERWKKVLDLEKTPLRYQTHKDAAATGRSFRIDVHFEV